NGTLNLAAKGLKDATVDGNLVVDNFAFAGPQLKGDTYSSKKVTIPIKVATAAAGDDSKITIQSLKIETDQLIMDITGALMQSALTNLKDQKPPGSDGNLALALNTKDLPAL